MNIFPSFIKFVFALSRLAASTVCELFKAWVCIYADLGVSVSNLKQSRGDKTIMSSCDNRNGFEIGNCVAFKVCTRRTELSGNAQELSLIA